MSRLSGDFRRIQQASLVNELRRVPGINIFGGADVHELRTTPVARGVKCSHQGGESSAPVCLNDDEVGGQCDGSDCQLFKLASRC